MAAGVALASVLGALLAPAPQVRVEVPNVARPRQESPAVAAELSAVEAGQLDRRVVRTRGTLDALEYPVYWQLTDGGARVAVIVLPEIGDALRALGGRRVEVVGLVRPLPWEQGTCRLGGQSVPASMCDDPDLPPLPDLKDKPGGWPHVSITAWQAMDMTPLERRGRDGFASGRLGAFLSGTPPEKGVTVRGRFCGAAACGPLKGAAAPGAWAIQDGEDAVWVVGKEPRGKGFRLDPGYAGDRARWLEVTGRLERCGPDWCLRAQKVVLTRPPAGPDE